MQVDVADIKQEAGSHKTVPLQVALEPVEVSGQSVVFPEPFRGSAEIWNAGDRLLVKAKLKGKAEVLCSRCLTSFETPLNISFDEEFVEGPQEAVSPREDEEELIIASTYEGDVIDLTDSIMDSILLELPMKPLCRPDCAGLCPTCGANLNAGPCGCGETGQVDPRLAALQKLLEKPDANS
ncbi:MAG TPA: DUF177 domain-containing protein [Symbiobacteriaceae bacterium]